MLLFGRQILTFADSKKDRFSMLSLLEIKKLISWKVAKRDEYDLTRSRSSFNQWF